MTTVFQEALANAKCQVRFLELGDEEAVKQVVILPFLQSINWNTANPEVYPQWRIGSDKVDYALQIDRRSKVFIEAKRWDTNLNDHEAQLLGYYEAADVKPKLATLTNGHEWRLYLPPKKGHPELRRFLSLDIVTDGPPMLERRLRQFLSRANLSQEKGIGNTIRAAERLWNKVIKDETVMADLSKAWNKLVSSQNVQVDVLSAFARESNINAETEHLKKFLKSSGCLFNSVIIKPRKPTSFKLGKGKPVPVGGWPDLKVKLCKHLYKRLRSRRRFGVTVIALSEWKDWFLTTDHKVNGYTLIGDSGIAIKVKGSKDDIQQLCSDMVASFGFSEEYLTINYS